ncbi:MAG TPA: capreomycidine synthase [Thermoanaerobaculia bacterium]|nr:capreomycidine synthase [Thermoanaerobaculia bacterium]
MPIEGPASEHRQREKFQPALLERWMREFYFSVEIDIGSSGVEDYSMEDLCRLLDFSPEELRSVVFRDSMTLGGLGLREALADRFLDGDVARVMATHGSSEANFLLTHALVSPGDEIVVLDPLYQQLYAIAEALGCRLRRWPLRFDRGYRPDLDDLHALLNERTRMVVVNFPHNPTGAAVTPLELTAVVEAASKVGAYLVWDCALAELSYETPPISQPRLLEYDRAVSLGTMSKAYGLPGLRVGWCLAAPSVLERMVEVRDYVTLALSPLVEWIAERAIRSGDLLVGPRLAQARRNRDLVAAWVEEQGDRVRWVAPWGGVTAFPRLDLEDSEPFCRRLGEKHGVMLVPGNCFSSPAHVRLGFGGPTALLAEGLRRLSACLEEYIEEPVLHRAARACSMAEEAT